MKNKRVYSLELKMKAIHLREKGWTFNSIAKELDITNVSKLSGGGNNNRSGTTEIRRKD